MRPSSKNNWNVIEPLGSDMSPRKYCRVQKAGQTAILMDCSAPQAPGHGMEDFVHIAEWLRAQGLKAPETYEQGDDFLIIEDFGDISFRAGIESGADAKMIYGAATDVLICLRDCSSPPHPSAARTPSPQGGEGWAGGEILELPDYYQSHVHAGRRRIIDWYVPQVLKKQNPTGWAESFLKMWGRIESALPLCPQGFIHGDFHLDNLMALFEEKGLGFCGILDFQGAMKGPIPYDLVNLLEDARADVDPEIKQEMKARYCAGMDAGALKIFNDWYDVLAMQFHSRAIGQFIKIALNGDPRYLVHLPRLERYIREGLERPVLAPAKAFFVDLRLDFNSANDLNAALSAAYIREDAF